MENTFSMETRTSEGPICCTEIQFSSVTLSCLTLCDPKDSSMPGFPVHHQLPEVAQTQVQEVGDNNPNPFSLAPSGGKERKPHLEQNPTAMKQVCGHS